MGVAAALAALVTPSMRNARDCLKPTRRTRTRVWGVGDRHEKWLALGSRAGVRNNLRLRLAWAQRCGQRGLLVCDADVARPRKIRGDRVHPVDDTLVARYLDNHLPGSRRG